MSGQVGGGARDGWNWNDGPRPVPGLTNTAKCWDGHWSADVCGIGIDTFKEGFGG